MGNFRKFRGIYPRKLFRKNRVLTENLDAEPLKKPRSHPSRSLWRKSQRADFERTNKHETEHQH